MNGSGVFVPELDILPDTTEYLGVPSDCSQHVYRVRGLLVFRVHDVMRQLGFHFGSEFSYSMEGEFGFLCSQYAVLGSEGILYI